jgi:hypothetical protein
MRRFEMYKDIDINLEDILDGNKKLQICLAEALEEAIKIGASEERGRIARLADIFLSEYVSTGCEHEMSVLACRLRNKIESGY